ncbi:MAG: hypothetical protein IJO22_03820 [Oscillospiraceae bacterium]|nr:hypothetical protein [Oscillospiraceae bacterium]
MSEIYYIQNRWKLENNKLYYYGLRNKENLFKNSVKLSEKQKNVIFSLPKELSEDEKKILGKLLDNQIVTFENLKHTPGNIREAHFCKKCCANDFIIPGLEFDENGLCPLCQTADDVSELKSVVPIVDNIPHSEKSRFDIALFYTGGKDSTFLLYYLAKVKKLRVLALTWEIPYISESARKSIENAKKKFSNVEFIIRTVNNNDLRKIYHKLYELSENTCACPSLAYILFYPELVANRIPYFMAGNEPVQMLGLYYNHMAPKFIYGLDKNKLLSGIINFGRIITLRPPFKPGQLQTLTTMRQLARKNSAVMDLFGYSNPLVSNVVKAIHEVPELLLPFKKAIKQSSRTGNIPAFVHFDFNEICGGTYNWNNVKHILVEECGWVPPDETKKALHTSCKIERCKDHSQFVRFYHCKTKMIPFSSLEISLASRNNLASKEDIIYEMENLLGFSLEEIPECVLMHEYLEDKT